MAFAIVLILLVIGTVIFHFASPWWFTEIASNWGMIDTTVNITFWVTGIVFVAINLFMALSIYKFNHHKGQKAHYEPENKKLEIWLTLFTAVGVAAMLAPGLFVWARFVQVPDDAAELEVRRDAVSDQIDQLEDVIRAFALVVLDEVNILRQQFNVTTSESSQLTSTVFVDRTIAQVKTSIRNKLGT